MKKLMIFCSLLMAISLSSNLQAQSAASLRNKVNKLEKDKTDKQAEIEKTEADIQQEIERGKEIAKTNPQAHGTNEYLASLRDDLKKKQEELAEIDKKLEKAKADLEAKLKKAVDDILKKYPIPDDANELDDYEKEMEKLRINGEDKETKEELRRRLKERIKAKRKELDEQGALPGEQNQSGRNDSHCAIGGSYISWFDEAVSYPDAILDEVSQAVYSDPALFEKLFETLGGEFFIGTFTEPGKLSNYHHSQPRFIGVNGEYWFNENFAIGTGLSKGRSASSAEFPITVINIENGSSAQSSGILQSEQKYFMASLQGMYSFGNGFLHPRLGAGLAYQRQAASTTEAIFGGERLAIQKTDAQSEIQLRALAGISAQLCRNFSVEANLNARRSGSELVAGVEFGLRVHFVK